MEGYFSDGESIFLSTFSALRIICHDFPLFRLYLGSNHSKSGSDNISEQTSVIFLFTFSSVQTFSHDAI